MLTIETAMLHALEITAYLMVWPLALLYENRSIQLPPIGFRTGVPKKNAI